MSKFARLTEARHRAANPGPGVQQTALAKDWKGERAQG